MAEETGLVQELGRRLPSRACGQLTAWDESDPPRRFRLSPNLSGRQFQDERLTAHVSDCLEGTGLDPEQVYLEVEGVKVDVSFIRRLGSGTGNRAIVETILTLGRELGLEVIAGGIETEDQLVTLRQMGCRLGQGFHFARPMSAERVPTFLRNAPPAGEPPGSGDEHG